MNAKLIVGICGILSCFSILAQTELDNSVEKPCISSQEYDLIQSKISTSKVYNLNKTAANPVTLIWPLKASDLLKDCSYYQISAYVDHHKTTGAIQDYNCGSNTYDGHKGTDISTWPFNFYKMDNDLVQVVAAASGTLIDKHDGEFDRNCSSNSLTANYVIIQHADGSVALYWHMKNGSITSKKVGDAIAAGDYVGVVGSSGSASGPHLHFEVWSGSTQATAIDPFAGTCNLLNANSWWESQKSYKETQIIKALVSSTDAVLPACPTTETSNEVSSFTMPVQGAGLAPGYAKFYIFLRDEISGYTADMSILNPDNSVFTSWTYSSTSNNGKKYTGWSKKLPTTVGKYTYVAKYNGITCSSTFDIFDVTLSAEKPLEISLANFSPNPSTGQFVLYAKNVSGQSLEVYNSIGEKVYESILSDDAQVLQLGHEAGVYFYTLKSLGVIVKSGKLIVQ